MLCSLAKRPGLSALISFGNIIQEMSKEGMPTETLPDGTPNMMNKMVYAVVKETFRALKEDANIQVALAPGSVNIVATGGNSGGPVTVTGPNINIATGHALIQ